MTIERINCQADHGDLENGCSSCGGHGAVLVQVKLDCGHKYWTRPGVYTYYDGKIFTSMDGLKIVCRQNGSICLRCQ